MLIFGERVPNALPYVLVRRGQFCKSRWPTILPASWDARSQRSATTPAVALGVAHREPEMPGSPGRLPA
jgi:hypothetical protein